MYLCGWVLVPIRISMMVMVALFMVFGYGLVSFLPRSVLRKKLHCLVSFVIGRLFLFNCGYWYINEQEARVEDYLSNYVEPINLTH